MKKVSIKDPSIAKEKYEQPKLVKNKLSHDKWVNYVENDPYYYNWLENTEKGIERLKNIDKIPQEFKLGILEQLNKSQVLAEYNQKKGWYEIVIDFHKDFGIISTTFMKPITKEHLKRLLDMANYLDAYLLNHGDEIIDDTVIENLS